MGVSRTVRRVANFASAGLIPSGESVAVKTDNRDKLLAEEKEKREIAEESVRKQKEKARRRLIFAGNAQNNLFAPTLGGIGGQQTLG